MSHNTINSDSDDERYEQKLIKRREETEARLREEEEQQWVEQKARKEARAVMGIKGNLILRQE